MTSTSDRVVAANAAVTAGGALRCATRNAVWNSEEGKAVANIPNIGAQCRLFDRGYRATEPPLFGLGKGRRP